MIGVIRDTPKRRGIETDFLARRQAAGIDATTIDTRSLTHGQVNAQIGAPGDTILTKPLVQFLDRRFKK